MSHGIDQQRAAGTVERLSSDNVMMAQQVTGLLNMIAITRAMQEGYRMACRDHDWEIPHMEDPAVALGMAVQE